MSQTSERVIFASIIIFAVPQLICGAAYMPNLTAILIGSLGADMEFYQSSLSRALYACRAQNKEFSGPASEQRQ